MHECNMCPTHFVWDYLYIQLQEWCGCIKMDRDVVLPTKEHMLCCLHLKRHQSGSWLRNNDIDIFNFRHRFCIVSKKFPEFKRVQNFAKKIWMLQNRKCKITKLNKSGWNYLSSNKHESKWNFFKCGQPFLCDDREHDI